MAVCTASSAVAALRNCARAVRQSNDVTADSLAADYANNVIEDFRNGARQRDVKGEERGPDMAPQHELREKV